MKANASWMLRFFHNESCDGDIKYARYAQGEVGGSPGMQ
jgi:hypothetical protein